MQWPQSNSKWLLAGTLSVIVLLLFLTADAMITQYLLTCAQAACIGHDPPVNGNAQGRGVAAGDPQRINPLAHFDVVTRFQQYFPDQTTFTVARLIRPGDLNPDSRIDGIKTVSVAAWLWRATVRSLRCYAGRSVATWLL